MAPVTRNVLAEMRPFVSGFTAKILRKTIESVSYVFLNDAILLLIINRNKNAVLGRRKYKIFTICTTISIGTICKIFYSVT